MTASSPQAGSTDERTTVAELRRLVNDFVDRRDWHKFHSPKNLAMSLAIEAAELMEHFQWISAKRSRTVATDAKKLARVGEELADVLCYALAMANELGLDLSTTIRRKMAKNEQKYPAEGR
jgi:NTP pyrophosphatase (non-canonical NTP hydrolase)